MPGMFTDLQDLGEQIHLYEPPTLTTTQSTPVSSNNASDPTLIILCVWMGGATPRRIQKYLTVHTTLFPRSAILILRTTIADNFYYSDGEVRKKLAPARDAIGRLLRGVPPGAEPSVLVHAMSNGGANTAVHLLRSLEDTSTSTSTSKSTTATNPTSASAAEGDTATNATTTLPLKGLILDCCPSDSSIQTLFAVIRASIPSTPLRMAALTAAYPWVYTLPVLRLLGMRHPVDEMRRELNDPAFMPREVRRLYVHGGRDLVVSRDSVLGHAGEAEERGYSVGRVFFEEGEHCALVREGRYVGVLREWWEGVLRGDGDGDRLGGVEMKSNLKAKL